MATNQASKKKQRSERIRTVEKNAKASLVKVGRAATNEKKAFTLLNEWIDAEQPIELISPGGVAFTGTLTRIDITSKQQDFLFQNQYGVHQVIFPMLYGRVWVEGHSPSSQGVYMEDPRGLLPRVVLRPLDKRVNELQIKQVCDTFRTWAKLGTKLRIMRGDALSMTMFNATAHEHLEGTYMFAALDGAFSCAVTPSISALIKYEYLEKSIFIQLFNTSAKSRLIVTDVVDNAEEALQRLATITQMIQ